VIALAIPTLDETVLRMREEVLRDMATGRVPVDCRSFSELHDHVDANEYGGFCEDALAEAMIEHFGGRDEHEGMPDGMMKYMNDAQNRIDHWLWMRHHTTPQVRAVWCDVGLQ